MPISSEHTRTSGNNRNTVRIAFMNILGQTGLNFSKQKQIENFLKGKNIDILNCQEINIDDNSFNQCPYITTNYRIVQNNATNKYGTASIIRNDFNPENIITDTYMEEPSCLTWEILRLEIFIYYPLGLMGNQGAIEKII